MRFSTLDMQYASKEKRQSWEDERKRKMKQNIDTLKSKVAKIDNARLSDWDRESIRRVSEIEKNIELEEIEAYVADIMRLAGLHYGLEREHFRQKERIRKDGKYETKKQS